MIASLAAGGPAAAAEISELQVGRDDGRYSLALSARLEAPLRASHAVFSDFARLPQINDAVEQVQLRAGAPDGAQRLYTRVRVCVWLVCRHLEQVQDIRRHEADGSLGLDARVLPALSNLRFGQARWRMQDCGGATCLQFRAELEPDFWVPPVVGPWAIERAMRREAVATAQGIERLARSHPR